MAVRSSQFGAGESAIPHLAHPSASPPGMQDVTVPAVSLLCQSGIGALAWQIILDKSLHNGVHAGISLEAQS